MLIRKINAGLSLLITFLLLNHTVLNAVRMLSRGAIEINGAIMAWVLFALMLLHAVISIDIVVSTYLGTKGPKCKSYPKMNIPTVIQRISGVILVLFTVLHVAGAAGFMHPPKVIHATVPALFFTIALAHTAVSTGKAFVTLGIGNAKTVKVVDILVKVICAAALIAALTGFYLYQV